MDAKESLVEQFTSWVRRSITLKLATLGMLMLILLIPATMIHTAIAERESTQKSAVEDITSKWAASQTIGGPWVVIPYLTRHKEKDGKTYTQTNLAHFLPESLRIEGTALPEIRHRGIYEAVLYKSDLKISGQFSPFDFSAWNIPPADILWKEAKVELSLSDMRGIRDNLDIHWGGSKIFVNPGLATGSLLPIGVNARVPVHAGPKSFPFFMDLHLNGSLFLKFYPFGKSTVVALNSPWPSPSFIGEFLPAEREVRQNGFKAVWKVLHLNRSYPQTWIGLNPPVEESSFGVQLLVPVDQYQRANRATKYAVLFILLTFGTFFYIEGFLGKALHILQYLLLGCGVILFYSLLLSLSEHLGFPAAYAIATCAITGLLTLYAKGIFGEPRAAAIVGGMVAGLYGVLYLLLQAEDYAFLIGNVGLFLALSTAMYLSRRVDWFKRA